MQLITSRLILRPLQENDGLAIAVATDETWDDLHQWMRWAMDRAERTNVKNCAAYAKSCHEAFAVKADFTFGGFLNDTGDFALISRLAPISDTGTYEFCGYWCRKKYQGFGYMTEAITEICRYAFDELGAETLQIKHAAGNDKTRAVMDKIGFTEKEILSNVHNLPDGSVVDEYVLTLNKKSF